jgi:hypothetical protein
VNSILKVVGVLSCGCLLALSLCTPTQAAENPSAGLAAHKESDRVKPDEGIKTIKGEVSRIKGQHFYVRRSDGKEMHVHTKPTTEMKSELRKGHRGVTKG